MVELYLCKQFGPRSGLTIRQARSGFKLFGHSDSIPEKIFFEQLILKKISQ